MTDIIELIDAYAEARHIQGHSTYNIKTAAARNAVIEALRDQQAQAAINSGAGGVQALSAAPARWVLGQKITEEMHVAACKVLLRGNGLDGLPQRMLDAMLAASPTPPAEQQAVSSAVLKAIRDANMQLVRTGDDAFMLVPYKRATAEQQAAPKAAPGERLTPTQASAMVAEMDMNDAVLAGIDAEAPQQEAQEPAFVDVSLRTAIAKAVYQQVRVEFDYKLGSWMALDADEQQRIVDSIRGLYTAPQPAPDCHHRPPCAECASLTAQGGKV